MTSEEDDEDTKPVLLKYYIRRVVSKIVVPKLARIKQENERKEHKSR
jgi:ribulose kinase